MSVQRYETADGSRWRVRWRDPGGGMRSRSFGSKRDANQFDLEVRSRKLRGEVLPRTSRQTLNGAFADWERLVAPSLARSTRQVYGALWNAHVRSGFGERQLSDLVEDPQLIDKFLAEMQGDGVGKAAQRKTIMVVSTVLTHCVRWKKIPTNPVRGAPKPPARRMRTPRPLHPLVVEQIRAQVQSRVTLGADGARASGDALLVSLLAYAGLRPQEALALRFGDVKRSQIIVDKAVAFGEEKETKTGVSRDVPLCQPLAADVQAWRDLGGASADADLLFPAPGGDLWSHAAYNNWRGRVWKPAVQALADQNAKLSALAQTRPYDCRGSFVSLHLRAGEDPLLVAKWAGHSPEVMWRHYASLIEELTGDPRVSAEEQIEQARARLEADSPEEVQELAAESMKPRSEVSEMLAEKLFAPRTGRLR